MTPGREDAPRTQVDLSPGRDKTGVAPDDGGQEDALAFDEGQASRLEDDASLRPLARALLALAEQLRREEAP